MVFSTDDDDETDPRRGMCFSTDDPVPEEEKKEQPARTMISTTTMITTNTFKEPSGAPVPSVELTSTRVGTNNPAFSRLPVADKHLLIAKHM